MKTLLIPIIVLAGCITVAGQGITVKTKDGKEISTTIRGITNKVIMTGNGEIKLDEIDTVTFPSKMQKDQGTYDRLEAAGVSVAFLGAPIIPEPQQPIAPVSAMATPEEQVTLAPVTTEQLAAAIEAYRKSRQLGMGLELAGTAMVLVGAFIYSGEPPENDVPMVLVAAGASLSLIGFCVSFGAGAHLRIERQ